MTDQKFVSLIERMKNLENVPREELIKEFCNIFGLDENYISHGTVPIFDLLEGTLQVILGIFRREKGYDVLLGSIDRNENTVILNSAVSYIPCILFTYVCGRTIEEKTFFMDFLKRVCGLYLAVSIMDEEEKTDS